MRLSWVLAIWLAGGGWVQAAEPAPARNWAVYFSPRGGCTEAVVAALGQAKNTVIVQAYSFTSAPIAKALVDASRRGVKVQAILDKSQKGEKYSSATYLANSGLRPMIDSAHAIAHNKVMVIDGQLVITGSFNFTKSAEENNAENLLIIRDSVLAARYAENWQNHLAHSKPYGAKTPVKRRVVSPRGAAK
jgi:phosphatidylserine/phosphatidylglycerophosphate/cardiolipin synthase-like enzyme